MSSPCEFPDNYQPSTFWAQNDTLVYIGTAGEHLVHCTINNNGSTVVTTKEPKLGQHHIRALYFTVNHTGGQIRHGHVSPQVATVKIHLADGTVITPIVRGRAWAFRAATSPDMTNAWIRAYDANGHLIEQDSISQR